MLDRLINSAYAVQAGVQSALGMLDSNDGTKIKQGNKSERKKPSFEELIDSIQGKFNCNKNEKATQINLALALIFDYNRMNNYGKAIMTHTLPFCGEYRPHLSVQCERKIDTAKKIVSLMNGLHYRQDAYLLIFWSMMILVLDKTDLEKHLSIICDFAQLIKISDEEIEEILQVVLFALGDRETKPEFKSKYVIQLYRDIEKQN